MHCSDYTYMGLACPRGTMVETTSESRVNGFECWCWCVLSSSLLFVSMCLPFISSQCSLSNSLDENEHNTERIPDYECRGGELTHAASGLHGNGHCNGNLLLLCQANVS